MDPDANLRAQRVICRALVRCDDRRDPITGALRHEDVEEYQRDASNLAELVQALDLWLSKGGSLPRPWQPKVQA